MYEINIKNNIQLKIQYRSLRAAIHQHFYIHSIIISATHDSNFLQVSVGYKQGLLDNASLSTLTVSSHLIPTMANNLVMSPMEISRYKLILMKYQK